MKKLLLLALSFGLLASCSKDDKNGIPPVDPSKPTDKPEDKPATALEAKDLKVADYESYRDLTLSSVTELWCKSLLLHSKI